MRHVRGLALALCTLLAGAGAPATAAAGVPGAPDLDRPAVLGREALPEAPAPDAAAEADLAPRHVLVRFADGVTAEQQRAVLTAAGARASEDVPGTGYVRAGTGGTDVVAVVAALAADRLVAHVQPDHRREASGRPDDPEMWQAEAYLDLVRLPRAWDVGTGSGAVVAVLDTGIDPAHADFAGRVVPGYDVVDDDADPAHDSWHGTAVAGVAMARGNDGVGMAGAAWGASVMPIRVLDANGTGSDSDIAAGITWAADHGADVINLSFGAAQESPVLLAAIRAAVARGSVVVAAAGDAFSEGVDYPAAYAAQVEGALAVSGTDDLGSLTTTSSWGEEVSLAAPATDIVAPWSGGGHLAGSGTSFAAPLVSGAAAILAARGADPAAVERSLVGTARDAGPKGVDPFYGHGVVDVAAALGLGRSLPLDREGRDPGPDDSVPARARPLPADGAAEATISPEGDQDWYSFTAPGRGWYRVTVTPDRDVLSGTASGLLAAITVLTDAGDLVRSVEEDSFWDTALELDVPVPAAGTVRIGVRNVGGAVPYGGYSIAVSPGPPARFAPSVTPAPPGTVTGLDSGDVTGDGIPDVVHALGGGTSVRVSAGVGDGTVRPGVEVPVGATVAHQTGLAVLDADGDRDADVVVGTTTGYVVLTQAAGALVARPPVTLAGAVWALAGEDVNRDGRGDLVLTVEGGTTQVHLAAGDGTFRRGADLGRSYGTFALGDVTGDGRPDLVALAGEVHAQRADGSFARLADVPADGEWSTSWGLALADVTGDGRPDVVRSLPGNGGVVGVSAGAGDGTFRAPVTYPAHEIPAELAAGDVNGDGRVDVVAVNSGWDAVTVLLQRPDGTLAPPEVVPAVRSQWIREGLDLVDLDRDGLLDAVVRGDLELQTLTQISLDRRPGPRAWVMDASPAVHSAGVGVRPTVRVRLGRTPAPGAVSASTVRLVDGATGTDVTATRAWDATTGTVSLVPTADLVRGGHYGVVVSGLRDLAGDAQTTPFRTWFTVAAGGERFTPVDPIRVLDTRYGTGAETRRVSPGSPVRLELGGIEVPPDATAVVLNVTAVSPTAVGNVRVYPTPAGDDVLPLVSNLNVVPGVNQPNLVTVALGADGRVSLATDGMTADLVADLAGWYREGGATAFVPMSPVRVMDTRDGLGGVPARPVPAAGHVDLVVTGRHGVPVDAAAVVLNVTATRTAGGTNVRVYPAPADSAPQDPPTVSNLNLRPGRDQPNLVTVAVGDGGRVRLYTDTAATDLVADLAGYFLPTGDHGFVPVEPVRVADSRSGLGLPGGPLLPGTPRTLTIGAVPATAAAVVANVTAVAPDGGSNVRVYPPTPDGSVPRISNLNIIPGRTEANLAVARLGTGRALEVYSEAARVHLVVDVAGYFRR